MQVFTLTILLFCYCTSACYAQFEEDGDVTPALNPLDVRRIDLHPDAKGLPEIGKGLCAVYEFSLNASVTADEVADFILSETPARYRSALYDEFVKGGTEFVSRLANVGCHLHKIKSWFLSHFHRTNNADTMNTLNKPFAGLKDSADIAIMHLSIEYIHAQRTSGQDLHLIPETMCQIHDLSVEETVSIRRILLTTRGNMPPAIRDALVKRVLELGTRDVAKIAALSAIGCKVLPAVVDVDFKNMPAVADVTEVTAMSAIPEDKTLTGTVVGICAVYEVVSSANITHDQVADFILNRTPQRFRSQLYEEFVKGGTTFVARVANVGCSMVKVRNVLRKMWPFGRLFHVMMTVSRPFGGLRQSDEFKLLHDAIEYIEKNRRKEGLMVIPETMCYIRKVSRDRSISKEQVIAEVEKKMPAELRKSLVEKIFRFGVNSIARLADVACKILPVHVEVDVKSTDVGSEDMAVSHVVPAAASSDVQTAGFPFMLGSKALCELHKLMQQRGITHEQVIEKINHVMPKPMRRKMIEKLTKEGIEKLAIIARVGCRVMPRLMMLEEEENFAVQPAGLVSTIIAKRESFCHLLQLGNSYGVSKSGVSQFIRMRFPDAWRKTLLGHLFERGLQAVVDVAHRMCFAPEN